MIKVFEGFDSMAVLMGGPPEVKKLVVDMKNDLIFVDGERLKSTPLYFPNEKKMFDKNLKKQKKPIFVYTFGFLVLRVDVGFDGRVFFKFFKRRDYNTFRGRPFRVFSYFNDVKNNERKWYDSDLVNPKLVLGVPKEREVLI